MAYSDPLIQCSICLEEPTDAVECSDCHNIFCEKCAEPLKSCAMCKKEPMRSVTNIAIRRVVDRMPIACEGCGKCVPRGDMAVHLKHCDNRLRKCSSSGCNYKSNSKEQSLKHIVEEHGNLLWENFEEIFSAGIHV